MLKGDTAYLVQVNPDGSFAERWRLGEHPTVIGRGALAQIKIPDKGISRTHFEILRKESGWLIRDLKSKYGTWVNGVGVTEALLRPHDRIRAGSTHFEFDAERPPGAQTPLRLHEGSAIPAVREYKNMLRDLASYSKR